MSAQRTTWGEIKGQIGQAIGLCGDNPDLLKYANEAGEYFWDIGNWVGSYSIYKLRIHGGCGCVKYITWPREILTIEALNACGQIVGIRNAFFEFIGSARSNTGGYGNGTYWGYGLNWGGGLALLGDRQEVITSEDLRDTPVHLKLYTERIEGDVSVLLLGYDENNNWIRTQDGSGTWQDGEYLSLENLTDSGVTSTKLFSALTGVQFTSVPRNGNTYLYQVDGDGVERQLATYDYAVKIPVFRRSALTGFNWNRSEQERAVCLTALCRMRWMPIMADTDYTQISSISAWKEMLMYIYKRDNGKVAEAEAHKQEAINILNNQLSAFNGVGAKRVVNFGPRAILGAPSNLF